MRVCPACDVASNELTCWWCGEPTRFALNEVGSSATHHYAPARTGEVIPYDFARFTIPIEEPEPASIV